MSEVAWWSAVLAVAAVPCAADDVVRARVELDDGSSYDLLYPSHRPLHLTGPQADTASEVPLDFAVVASITRTLDVWRVRSADGVVSAYRRTHLSAGDEDAPLTGTAMFGDIPVGFSAPLSVCRRISVDRVPEPVPSRQPGRRTVSAEVELLDHTTVLLDPCEAIQLTDVAASGLTATELYLSAGAPMVFTASSWRAKRDTPVLLGVQPCFVESIAFPKPRNDGRAWGPGMMAGPSDLTRTLPGPEGYEPGSVALVNGEALEFVAPLPEDPGGLAGVVGWDSHGRVAIAREAMRSVTFSDSAEDAAPRLEREFTPCKVEAAVVVPDGTTQIIGDCEFAAGPGLDALRMVLGQYDRWGHAVRHAQPAAGSACVCWGVPFCVFGGPNADPMANPFASSSGLIYRLFPLRDVESMVRRGALGVAEWSLTLRDGSEFTGALSPDVEVYLVGRSAEGPVTWKLSGPLSELVPIQELRFTVPEPERR